MNNSMILKRPLINRSKATPTTTIRISGEKHTSKSNICHDSAELLACYPNSLSATKKDSEARKKNRLTFATKERWIQTATNGKLSIEVTLST